MGTHIGSELWRIEYRGSLGTEEIFSHGFWVTADSGAVAADLVAAAQLWIDSFTSAVGATGGLSTVLQLFGLDVTWLSSSVRPYNASTHLPTALPTDTPLTVALTGGGGQSLPYQDALAVTFWNGEVTGRERYNRTYLPPFTTTVLTTSSRVFATVQDAIGNAVTGADSDMQALTPSVGICVYQRKPGTVTGANQCRLDTIIDTQRRRRNGLSSDYQLYAFS